MLDVAEETQKINWKFCFFFLVSLGLMLFAQPDLSHLACIFASICGFSLFWFANNSLKKKKDRFWSALIWFFLVFLSHLNWFMADRYVGFYIFIFLGLWLFVLSLCFSLLSHLVPSPQELTISKALQISSIWTLLEWGRLFLLSGFSWNPLGIMMTRNIYSLQMASLFGILGLSFWVVFTNLMVYKLFQKDRSLRQWVSSSLLIFFPFLFGFIFVNHHSSKMEKSENLSVLLLQTSLYPEEKMRYKGFEDKMIPLYEQWQRIFHLMKNHEGKEVDLIVLSEGAVPYGTSLPLYQTKEAKAFFKHFFSDILVETSEDYVGNAFFAQNLAKRFQADFVIGFEDIDKETNNVYNAAFLFHPQSLEINRYDKRILVPMGEYIPFSFCKKFLAQYGIYDSFTPGKEAKVFEGKKIPLGFSICYEETYGHLMRHNRQKGASLLVNLTNDVWYPHSRLPIVHYYHGRVRAVESGIPLVRSCNTGVTCAVDSLGRMIDQLPFEKKGRDSPCSSLHVQVPTYSYKTLYTYLGDTTIVSLACLFLCFEFFLKKRKKCKKSLF